MLRGFFEEMNPSMALKCRVYFLARRVLNKKISCIFIEHVTGVCVSLKTSARKCFMKMLRFL